MIAKQLFVASQVQIELLKQVIIPELNHGFWKDHRPADHGKEWLDLELVITKNGQVGPFNFKVPRLYNFTNPEFMDKCEDILISTAQSVDPTMNRKKVRKALNELSQIVGGRLTDLSEEPTKAFRGNNVPDNRGEGNVLTSGKGLGSDLWLPSMNALIESAKTNLAVVKTSHTYFFLERGARKLKVFINGSDSVVLSHNDGEVITTMNSPSEITNFISKAILALTSVNMCKDLAKREKGDSTTTINGDTVVRRVAIVRPKITAEAGTAADPFGLVAYA